MAASRCFDEAFQGSVREPTRCAYAVARRVKREKQPQLEHDASRWPRPALQIFRAHPIGDLAWFESTGTLSSTGLCLRSKKIGRQQIAFFKQMHAIRHCGAFVAACPECWVDRLHRAKFQPTGCDNNQQLCSEHSLWTPRRCLHTHLLCVLQSRFRKPACTVAKCRTLRDSIRCSAESTTAGWERY